MGKMGESFAILCYIKFETELPVKQQICRAWLGVFFQFLDWFFLDENSQKISLYSNRDTIKDL